MHLEEALSQLDREKFTKKTGKEYQYHIKQGHWKVIPANHFPKDEIPLQMVWSTKRKRDPIIEIKKYKSRLWAGGHNSI